MSTPTCNVCKREFSFKSNLTRHLKMVHQMKVERLDLMPHEFDAYNYKCIEGCNVSFKYNRDLRNHLKIEHNMELTELNFEFPNEEAFNKWLHEEEENNCIQYIHVTSSKKRGTTGIETFYYECSRTGKYHYIDDSVRKRKARKCGTLKLDRGCTSQIIVNKSHMNGTLYVVYHKNHYGHDLKVEHLKLSKQARGAIASKLLLGMPISSVVDSVQILPEEMSPNGKEPNIKRINLLRRKDVLNIRKSYKIRDETVSDDISDSSNVNITSFIDQCLQSDHNPIMYHNLDESLANNTNIIIAIMTDYQREMLLENSNVLLLKVTQLENCDFELTTLHIFLDDKNIFPTVCMFSNGKNQRTYELFFEQLKQKLGLILKPSVLVTDCNQMYSEAWDISMGQVEYHFYNYTQIDIDWKLNINRINTQESQVTKVKRLWVYDTLKILQSYQEESEFLENYEETIKLLKNDQDFRDFLTYFLHQYRNPKQWADCYQPEWYSNYKNCSKSDLLAKADLNERFDKVFVSIIKLIRQETIASLVRQGKVGELLAGIDKRHEIKNLTCCVEQVEDNIWNVIDRENDNKPVKYLVEKSWIEKSKCCNIMCTECRICVHSFSCSCIDYFVNCTICKHIHFICLSYFGEVTEMEQDWPEGESESGSEENEMKDEEIIIEINEDDGVEDENCFKSVADFLQNEVRVKAAELCNSVSQVTSEKKLGIILKGISQLNELVKTGDSVECNLVNIALSDHSYL